MNMNEFNSEIELRKSFKCETFKGDNDQILIVHKGEEKIAVPFNNYTSELDFGKAKPISETEYLQIQNQSNIESKKNNYYFSK